MKQSVCCIAKALQTAVLLLLISVASASAQTTQEQVHQMSHHVMPFTMSETMHVFTMTEFGGVQKVVAKDAAAHDQIAMIQQHLRHEAERFQQGDYSDPAMLHGAMMPGLKELQAGSAGIAVTYSPLTTGAQIRFETTDLHLLTAIHRWFGAQLSEHGADARAE
ncbi:hypothetical protein [Amphritea pacifica]|uniref:Aspartate carbamoyltransferase n=1 Tax=Amphritea pacifica TaxID=2811233 RepID=A0ABS2WCU2_9GAMM|nr:hypothetical protein [Amphritea pacifica]MBN0989445.1 hypothetical protein [Amphritea pacifica]MBN1006945.1 hypothetical protein [Amphritea pacifica]